MRYLLPYIQKDLGRKMVFVGGPRQCGKTTLAKALLARAERGRYFDWDLDEDRRDILEKKWADSDELLVFDELHKFPRWKTWLKGVFDANRNRHRMLVAGSARLDVYRRGGDSMLGRYHYWRLHPFTLDEYPRGLSFQQAFDRLMTLGGFPEPFLEGDEREARRWRRARLERVLRDDVRDLESVRDIQTLSLFVDLLRSRVGGMVVLASLANELQVAPKTAGRWLEVIERMYLAFAVRPVTKKIPRAVLKPPKVYFFDNGDVIGDQGARFENLVATHLLKRIHFLGDRDGYRYELRYIRNKEGREVYFAILKEDRVEMLVEAKWSDDAPSRGLTYYADLLDPARTVQVVAGLRRDYGVGPVEVVGPRRFFADPPWGEAN